MIEICSKINVDLNENQIVSSSVLKNYTVKSKRGEEYEKCLVMINFSNDKIKNNIFKEKKKLKNTNFNHVIINEALTSKTKVLFNYAKQLAALGFQSAFVSSGRVFAKKERDQRPMLLKTKDEIDELLTNSVL